MKMNKEKRTTLIGFLLLIICIGMFITGYNNGEKDTVLAKARNICLECIGIW